VEIGGKKYIVPKAVEDHLLREEDYTQKTQTLAEQRREVEAYQASLQEKAQLQEAVIEDISQVRGLDAQLQQFDQIDWPAYHLQDPNAAQFHWLQFQQLKGFREQAAAALNQKMQHVSHLRQKYDSETVQKTVTALSKPDPKMGWPGYSKEHMAKLTEAAREFGITDEEMPKIKSPTAIKIINLALFGSQALKKAASGNVAPKVEAQPVRQISSNRGRSSPSASGDNLSTDEWLARERKRMTKTSANGAFIR